MAKSRAEIQKAYRERQKAKNNEEYLKKERERRRRNYVPTAQLSRRDRIRRNIKNNDTLKRHRQRKKEEVRLAAEAAAVIENEETAESVDSSGYDSPGSQPRPSSSLMIVRLPFVNRRKGGRKRISRSISKKTRELSKLKTQFHELTKKHRTTLRRFQRLKKKLANESPKTPRSKTDTQIRAARLSEDQGRKVRRQLLLGNALLEEVRVARIGKDRRGRKALNNIIAGRIVRKYRCISSVSSRTGASRNKLGKVHSKIIDVKKQETFRQVRRYKDEVIRFFQRDDNSRNLPGKADKVKVGVNMTLQKRVLTDYLSSLHMKFLSENPSVNLSLASFQRIRPKHILTTSFITRDSCLCTKHQNMALLLKAIKGEGVQISVNPEKYLECTPVTGNDIVSEEVSFEQWRRVTVEENERKKLMMKIVKVTKSKEDFLQYLELQTTEFRDHAFKMKNQYEQIRLLKEKLPLHHAIVHMDFAENYACKSAEEIQSAYWNQSMVTLHPTVIYTKTYEQEPIKHQSFVIISDELAHNATTVATFIKQIIADVKELDPTVECVHFWTDSPTSQYRNKTIFHIVANHQTTTGIKAIWNYFEAGHGKGPCDGLGGVTKRMADQAMKSGKAVIQDASDFFAWTQSPVCTMRNVKFRYITKETCQEVGKDLADTKAKPVKGTMKIHAVVGLGNNCIFVRDVSCYCDACRLGNYSCDWRKENTSSEDAGHPQEQSALATRPSLRDDHAKETGLSNEPTEVYEVDDFVAAIYEGSGYIGKIVEVDTVDDSGFTYLISFMKRMKKMFQWPMREDVIWCRREDVQCKVSEPVASGKSKRMLTISNEDWAKIDTLPGM